MVAGCAGISLGRNIFQHRRPDLMTAALRAIIIDSTTVREANEILRSGLEPAPGMFTAAEASR
jgi:hypothetical protein